MSRTGSDCNGRTSGDDEHSRHREMFAQSPDFSALLSGPNHRFVLIIRHVSS